MNVKLVKIHPEAVTPVYSSDGAACFDIFSVEDMEIYPNCSHTIKTGIKAEIPDGYVMLLFSRSSQAFKYDTRLANCVGVIDSDYRGEVKIRLHRDTDTTSYQVCKGDRIAQAMVIPVPKVSFVEVDELSETTRGEKGIGSTGK